jgi:AraC-like DNA-binding protein
MIGLLVIGVFQAALLVLLLLTKRKKSTPDYILAGYLFLSALLIFFTWLEIWSRNNDLQILWLTNLRTPLILLIGPILWLYVKSVTDQHFRFKPKYLLTLIPFLLVLGLFTARDFLQPQQAVTAAPSAEPSFNPIFFFFITGLIAISNLGYTLWGLLLIRRYKRALKTFFSSTEKINLQWLEFIHIAALTAYTSISGLYIISGVFEFMSYQVLQQAGYGIAALLVLVIGFFGIRKGSIFTSSNIDFDMEKAIEEEEEVPPKLTSEEEIFVHRLLEFMKTEKPHLDPEINLALLSSKLKVSPEYLSDIINSRLNKNFYDFINHYRIEEFKQLCKAPESKKLTLISLAYDSGFNSKATFNRVFKKEMNCTPSEYYNRVSIS